MENSRVNLSGLMLALIAGIVAFQAAGQSPVTSLAGLTLLIGLFAYGHDAARTGLQSFAFALVCGVGFLCAITFPLYFLIPLLIDKPPFMASPYFPALLWLIGTVMFWFVDRASSETPQAVTLSGYPPSAIVTQPQPVTRPFTPAPVTVAAPIREREPEPEPVSIPNPEPAYAASAAASASAPSAPAPIAAPLTGKEVSIYVTMLGEGMNVLRSVRAEHLGRDFYVITEDMPADENWQFVTGQVVRCKKKNLSNGKGLVAFEEAPRAQ